MENIEKALSSETDRALLQVRRLRTVFETQEASAAAVDDVTFSIRFGETLGLVGESGCGKTLTALSILRLVRPPGYIASGEILLDGTDLLSLSRKEMRQVRGKKIGMVFQEPASVFNPFLKIGTQAIEGMQAHLSYSSSQAWARAVELLDEVGIPRPEQCMQEYPHQLSGGMRQRVLLAMALGCEPQLLIADEPTTALDVTIQAQILHLLRRLKEKHHLSMLLISHELGVIAEMCDQVAVMQVGKIVESGTTEEVFYRPQHSYTRKLLTLAKQLQC